MGKDVTFNIRLNIDGKDKVVVATTAVDNLRNVVNKANGDTKALYERFINTNQVVESVRSISDGFSSLAGVLNNLTAESRDFGGAMAAANTMAGKSGEEFSNLKDQVAELSHTIPVARDELANGLYQVISNGVPEDNWIEYLNQSARASVGGIADLGETVKVTSTIIKNYGMEWSDAGPIQDKIQLTAKNGVTSFEQLAQALPRVTSSAATLGVSIDELMATFSTLTGVSGNTAEVSTQLAAIFTALIKPSSEASEMAQQMGIQFDAAAIKAAGGMSQFLASLDKSVKQYAASSGMLEQEIYGKLFGSAESLRAITPLTNQLADKFRENVSEMQNSAGTIDEAFNTMASTGGATLQMLNNKLGEYTDMLQSSVGNILPYINFGSQVLVASTSAITLAKSMNVLGVASKVSSLAVAAFGPIVQVCSATMRGAAVSAQTLRLAIRSLMITTGVGIAIAALTEIINHLASSSNAAADSTENLSMAEEQAKAAHQQSAQQIASVRSEMDMNIARLKDFRGSKEQEKNIVQQMNAKYGEAMGYYPSVSQWYQALTANSEAYCNQMINEIRLRELANQASSLIQKQRDIRYNEDGSLKKYSKKNKTRTETVGQVDAGDGKIIPVMQEVEVKGTSQLDEANKKYAALHRQQQRVKKEMENIVKENNKISFKHTQGYSPTAPTTTLISGGGRAGGKGNHTSPTPTAKNEPAPLEGSIDWYNQAIEKKKKELEATASDATRKQLQGEMEGLQRELGMIKIKAGIETVPPVEVKKETKGVLDEIDDQMDNFLKKYENKPIAIDMTTNIKQQDLERIRSLFNIDTSNFESVKSSINSIKDIVNPTAQGLATAGASCEALGGAMQQLGGDSAAAKAGMVMAAIGQIALSFAQALNSASSNWVTWLAFGIAGTAQMISMIATISKFATGGIVGGNQTSGDNVLVRVNSGEMILNAAQQARLFALANGAAVYGASAQVGSDFSRSASVPAVSVQSERLQSIMSESNTAQKMKVDWRLRGRDLVASIANETRSNRKRSNIR